MKRRILVVDVGGTSVKLLRSRRDEREFPSGPRMGPEQFVARFAENVCGWKFDMTSIGFPAPVRKGQIVGNPDRKSTRLNSSHVKISYAVFCLKKKKKKKQT